MRHLVTGGSGFWGSLLARRLMQSGEEVRIFDLRDDPNRSSEIEFIQGDVLDADRVAASMRGADVVHHAAALVPLTRSEKRFFQVNVHGSEIVAREAARAGVQMVVNTSSSAIYGKPPCPIGPDTVPEPIEKYGQSKLDGERVMSEILKAADIPMISVRPRAIIGEGRLGIFQILFDWIKDGRRVYVLGDGKARIQFLHARDLADAYMLLVRLQKPGFYNVGTDRFAPLADSLANLIDHAGTSSRVTPIPAGLAIGTLRLLYNLHLSPLVPWHYLTYGADLFFDVEPMKKLGWQPAYSNDEMLVECYDYFVDHYDEIMNPRTGASVHRSAVQQKILWLLKRFS